MTTYDAIDQILELSMLKQDLLLIPGSKPVTTSTEMAVIRCPLCGDSPHKTSAHMYIGVKEIDSKFFPTYDCKFCGQNGAVTINLLRRIGVNDLNVEAYIKSLRNTKFVKNFTDKDDTSKIQWKYPKPTSQDKEKIEYVSSRLGLDMGDYENIRNYRIVYNFARFLELNNITKPGCSKDTIEMCTREGVGFVSSEKVGISIRNMHPNESLGIPRFNIIKLFTDIAKPFYYMPPCQTDLIAVKPKIVVSESAFNIINIQNYFHQGDTDCIFGAAARKGYYRLIKYLIEKTGFTGGEILVYADYDKNYGSDGSDDYTKFIIQYFEESLADFMETFTVKIILNTEIDPETNKRIKDFGEQPLNGKNYMFSTIKLN